MENVEKAQEVDDLSLEEVTQLLSEGKSDHPALSRLQTKLELNEEGSSDPRPNPYPSPWPDPTRPDPSRPDPDHYKTGPFYKNV